MAQYGDDQQEQSPSRRASLLETVAALGKRRVFTTAALYIPAAWLAVEIASFVLGITRGSDRSLRLVIALAAGGFPVAIYLAWVFDITRDGIVRTQGVFRTTPVVLALTGIVLAGSTYGFWQLLAPAPIGAVAGPCDASNRDTTYLASVGVLPFRFLSGESDDANIAEGFTEDIRSLLSKLENFCIPARVPRSAIAANRDDLSRVGEFLNVSYLLDGTVQLQGDTIKVTAELINSSSGLLEWSDTYQGDKSSLFAMQGDISRGVVAATHPTIVDDIEHILDQRDVGDAESHYLFLLGRHFFYQYGVDAIDRATEHYERAIELDDTNAVLYAEIAKAYQHSLQMLAPEHWGERPLKANAALARALELNPNLPSVQTAVGKLSHDPAEATRAYQRAIELDPNHAEALDWLSQQAQDASYERCLLESDSGLAEHEPQRIAFLESAPEILFDPLPLIESAHKLDPYNGTIVANLANYYAEHDRRGDALELLKKSAKFMPDSAVVLTHLGRQLQESGQLTEGLQRLQQAIDLDFQGWRMLYLILGYLSIEDSASADVWLYAQGRMTSRAFINGHFRFWLALQTDELDRYLESVDADVNPVEQARAMLYTADAEQGAALLSRMFSDSRLWDKDALWAANELGWTYRELGREDEARSLLEAVANEARKHNQCDAYTPESIYWATILAMLGEWDEATAVLRWLSANAPGRLLQAQHVLGFAILEENDDAWQIVSDAISELEQEKQRWQRIRASEFLQPR